MLFDGGADKSDVAQWRLPCGEDLGDVSADLVVVDGGSGESRCCRSPLCCSGCRPGDGDLIASDPAHGSIESNGKENFLGCGRAGGISEEVDPSVQVRARSMPRRRELARSWLATAAADLGDLGRAT